VSYSFLHVPNLISSIKMYFLDSVPISFHHCTLTFILAEVTKMSKMSSFTNNF
jgi:hypothetical protein